MQGTTRCIGGLAFALILGFVLASPGMAGEAGASPRHTNTAGVEILDEVLVTGEQPGPPLWQVKSGTHVLWVLASPSMVPEKLKWRSKQVEKVLAGADEVLVPFWGTHLPPRTAQEAAEENKARAAFREQRYLPDGQTLRDVLSPEDYARYEAAVARFAKGQKDAARLAPPHATNMLLVGAIRALDITLAPIAIWTRVENMAASRRIRVTRVGGGRKGEELGKELERALKDTCPLENMVRQLEDGGAGWKALANAWSVGDMERLRRLMPMYGQVTVTAPLPCKDGVEGEESMKRSRESVALAIDGWLPAAERALSANASTLAVVSITLLLEPDGLVEVLRGRGYEVVEP